MKHQINFISVVLIIFLFLPEYSGKCQSLSNKDSIPDALKPFIKAIEEPCEFKEIPDYIESPSPDFITKEQAREDIDMLHYIIDNAYSGKHYWERNGVDFEGMHKKLLKYIDSVNSDRIEVKQLKERMIKGISVINDGHIWIGSVDEGTFNVYRPYYAEVIIEKQENKFVVIESNQPNVRIGSQFLDSQEYLYKTISKNGSNQYLIGKLSTEQIDTLQIRFDKEIINLVTHKSRTGNVWCDDANRFHVDTNYRRPIIDTIDNIPVIITKSFGYGSLEEFYQYGKTLKDKPVFVWSLIDNTGGNGSVPQDFVKSFNGFGEGQVYSCALHSPVINQSYWKNKNGWLWWPKSSKEALDDDNYPLDSIPESRHEKIKMIRLEKQTVKTNPKKYWEIRPKPEKKYGNYKGKAIILTNCYTNSAGNDAVSASKSIPNCIIVGENTAPGYAIGNGHFYCLKNSLIKFDLPSALGIHPDNHLEKGFFPDYWLDSKEPIKEVIDWIHHPDTYRFSYKKL